MKKSIHRVVLVAIAMLMGSFALVAVSSAPAQAATATTTLVGYSAKVVTHGGRVSFQTAVRNPSNQAVTSGTVVVERRIVGQSAFRKIYERPLTSTDYQPTWRFKPNYSAYYRVRYLGNSSYNASTSQTYRINVRRNLRDRFRKADRLFYGKVTPRYGNRVVLIQKSTCARPKSSNCRWRAYKRIKTRATGNWAIRLPVQRRRTHFRGVVGASNGYAGNYSRYFVTTYRY